MSTLTAADWETLRWGYTLANLDKFAKTAVGSDRSRSLPPDEAYQIAWSSIATALYESEVEPTPRELIQAGWTAIYAEVRAERRHAGYDIETGQQTPRFTQFWGATTNQFEASLIDKIATQQIMAILGDTDYEALMARAACDDLHVAAAALGCSYKALCVRLVVARRTFAAWWHEGETPRTHGDGECKQGHSREKFGRINHQGKWHCRECHRMRAASARRNSR